MPTMAIDVNAAIEVAEHNRAYALGRTLIVFDTLRRDRYYGIRLEVTPGATALGGWCALCRDGVGNSHVVWHKDRTTACENALAGYRTKVA